MSETRVIKGLPVRGVTERLEVPGLPVSFMWSTRLESFVLWYKDSGVPLEVTIVATGQDFPRDTVHIGSALTPDGGTALHALLLLREVDD